MRQGQQNRRNRGRSRGRTSNPLSRNYESNGPDVKIKGTAAHIAEKYMALARDALSSGNTVTAEAYFQHAEHYNRIIMAAQVKQEDASQSSGRSRNNDRRETEEVNGNATNTNGSVSDKAAADDEAAESIPGTGEQPELNSDAVSMVLKDSPAPAKESKPKSRRAPRSRKPKAAPKSENPENGEAAPSAEDSNVTV